MSVFGKWTFKFRDDQADFLKSMLAYIIERHDDRINNIAPLPIDKFAHARSRERAQEILDEITQVIG